jgi:hypothetical protein
MDGIPKCLKKDQLFRCRRRNGDVVFRVGVPVVVLKKFNLACGLVLPLSIIGPSCAKEVRACMRDGPSIIHAPSHWP